MRIIVKCPKCGSGNPDDAKFCKNCGTELKSEYKYCPECGNELKKYKNFCRNCGYRFKEGKEGWSTKKKVGVGILGFFIFLFVIGAIGALLGIGEEIPETKLNVSNLRVSPTEVGANQTVNISIDVENPAENEATEILNLDISGETKSKSITLGSNETKTVTFRVSREKTGSYAVSIGDLSESFQVMESPPKPIHLEGTGTQTTETFTLVEGLSIFHMVHDGESWFRMELMHVETGEEISVPFLPLIYGSFEGSTIVGVGSGSILQTIWKTLSGEHLLNVTADGDWEISIEQPKVKSAPGVPQEFSGKTYGVSSPFYLEEGLAKFQMVHDGSFNFMVLLYDKDGNRVEEIARPMGSFNGSKTIHVSSGIYYLDISADGNWTVIVTQ